MWGEPQATGGPGPGKWAPGGSEGRVGSRCRAGAPEAGAQRAPSLPGARPVGAHAPSLRPRRAAVGGGERRRPAGLREGQRPVPEGAELQLQVPHAEAVRGGQGDQLQPGVRPRGQGRVPQRHGGAQAEVALQLPLQARHEEGEELPAHLLEHVPEPAGYAPPSLSSPPSSPPPPPAGPHRGLADLILHPFSQLQREDRSWPLGDGSSWCLPPAQL